MIIVKGAEIKWVKWQDSQWLKVDTEIWSSMKKPRMKLSKPNSYKTKQKNNDLHRNVFMNFWWCTIHICKLKKTMISDKSYNEIKLFGLLL